VQDRRLVAPVSLPARRITAAIVVAVAATSVLVDQLAKTLAEHALRDRTVELILGMRLVLTYNSGAAFSVGSGRSGFFTVLASITVTALLAYALWTRHTRLRAVMFGLIVGGAAGNLVDRLARPNHGRVIDFIEIAHWWPVFNVADMSLFFGIALMVLISLREPKEST
jgi:signal peptidase II